MNPSRLCRCLRLINFLRSRVGRNIDDFAHECGVSKRTVYRDLRALEEAGISVRNDAARGGHLIEPRYRPNSSPVTHEEIVFLALAATTSVFSQIEEFAGIINQSIDKLVAQAPERQRNEAVNLLQACQVEVPAQLPLDDDTGVLRQIVQGIRLGRRVRIRYRQAGGPRRAIESTCVSPYRLVASARGWQLLGRSSLHRKVRSFPLRQIIRAEITSDAFQTPPRLSRRKTLNVASGS
jgi:predicted DNA-binding transcriptional regulator YafY